MGAVHSPRVTRKHLTCLLLPWCFLAAAPAAASRLFVTPIGFPSDAELARTLTRAVETAVVEAIPGADVTTTAALDTAVELQVIRECVSDQEQGSCISEIAQAVDVDFVVRPHLGQVGSELVLTLSVLDGNKATVLAQGNRRTALGDPARLLDVIPGLVREVADGAGLPTAPGRTDKPPADAALDTGLHKPLPALPLALALVGVVGAGLGVGLQAWALVQGYRRSQAELSAEDAAAIEQVGPAGLVGGSVLLLGGIGCAGLGGSMLLFRGE